MAKSMKEMMINRPTNFNCISENKIKSVLKKIRKINFYEDLFSNRQ